ncbi:hypothetical protein BV898_07255 [Hypsibius exemplaris]|uniref:Uncharacterized protein n=1 Tax=Hypsibius exemplaris TaxID=2072580 RepID=A0A1W0WTV0_HYPEX|nr:hypothetical protein BV898_07255 [Hypsibius exemplaris]
MWDWITFGICVASLVPSIFLIGLLLRYLLKNSERRCFKDASEDCEILVSTSVARPVVSREILREYTHRQVVGAAVAAGNTVSSAHPSRSNLQLTESPPEYSVYSPTSTTNNEMVNETTSSADGSDASPPIYGSQISINNQGGPSYSRPTTTTTTTVSGHPRRLFHHIPSLPLNLNSLITSLDLLPEFATLPPPPSYDEVLRSGEPFRC